MTLNIWGYRGHWPARCERVLQFMQDEELDLILLQDVSQRPWQLNQAAELAQMSGYAMAFAAAERLIPWLPIGSGLAVLSRFPITHATSFELCGPRGWLPRGRQERHIAERVEISIEGMSVVIYNTHFPPEPAARRLAAQRLWGQVRSEESVLVLVGGNFNAAPDELSVNFLQGHVDIDGTRGTLTDAWLTAGMGPAETYPARDPHSRIDYIFYQAEPSVSVQEARVAGYAPGELANHAAVLATFTIAPARDPVLPFEEEPVATLEPTGGGYARSY